MKPFKRTLSTSLLLVIILVLGLGWTPSAASLPLQEEEPPRAEPEAETKTPASPFAEPRFLGTRQVVSVAPLSAGGPDNFGYTYTFSTYADHEWQSISNMTPIELSDSDVGVSEPVTIPFNFKFYENSYNRLYISANGLITFGGYDEGVKDNPIPSDIVPNNFIAPFWDDLVVPLSNESGVTKPWVWTALQGAAPERSFIIEWRNVTRFESTDILTFRVILREKGDITFLYKDVKGDVENCTIGIEDGDGVDGLQVLRNSPGLTEKSKIQITRPPATARVKTLKRYVSELAVRGQARLRIQIRNTGEKGTDRYNLSIAQTGHPVWPVSFYKSDGVTALADTNGDGIIDTGPVAQGETIEIVAVLKTPDSSLIGEYTMFNIVAASTISSSRTASVAIQSAIPAAFAQAVVDTEKDVGLDLIAAGNRTTISSIEYWFSGSTLAIQNLLEGGFIYAWEKNENNSPDSDYYPFYTDIEFTLLDSRGVIQRKRAKLTDNKNQYVLVTDQDPGVASAPNGAVGIAWLRVINDFAAEREKTTVFLSIIDSQGNILHKDIMLADTDWRESGELNMPVYNSPRIAATGDNRFVVTWGENRLQTASKAKNDIFYSVYSTNGSRLKENQKLTSSLAGELVYIDPAVTGFGGNRALLSYSEYKEADDSYSILYLVLSSNGNIEKAPGAISNARGWRPDAVQLASGKILLAWTDSTTDAAEFAVLNPNPPFNVEKGPNKLENPYARPADNVSVTYDRNGHGIITWIDALETEHLYYALVNGSGSILTPAMIFFYGGGYPPFVATSSTGQGNTFYAYPYALFLPLTRR